MPYIEDISGMTELNDRQFTVQNATADTFELADEDGTGHTAYVSGGTATRRGDYSLVMNMTPSVGKASFSLRLTVSRNWMPGDKDDGPGGAIVQEHYSRAGDYGHTLIDFDWVSGRRHIHGNIEYTGDAYWYSQDGNNSQLNSIVDGRIGFGGPNGAAIVSYIEQNAENNNLYTNKYIVMNDGFGLVDSDVQANPSGGANGGIKVRGLDGSLLGVLKLYDET